MLRGSSWPDPWQAGHLLAAPAKTSPLTHFSAPTLATFQLQQPVLGPQVPDKHWPGQTALLPHNWEQGSAVAPVPLQIASFNAPT